MLPSFPIRVLASAGVLLLAACGSPLDGTAIPEPKEESRYSGRRLFWGTGPDDLWFTSGGIRYYDGKAWKDVQLPAEFPFEPDAVVMAREKGVLWLVNNHAGDRFQLFRLHSDGRIDDFTEAARPLNQWLNPLSTKFGFVDVDGKVMIHMSRVDQSSDQDFEALYEPVGADLQEFVRFPNQMNLHHAVSSTDFWLSANDGRIVRFDGTQVTVDPHAPGRAAMSSSGSDNVWFASDMQPVNEDPWRFMHFDGQQWSLVEIPQQIRSGRKVILRWFKALPDKRLVLFFSQIIPHIDMQGNPGLSYAIWNGQALSEIRQIRAPRDCSGRYVTCGYDIVHLASGGPVSEPTGGILLQLTLGIPVYDDIVATEDELSLHYVPFDAL